MSQNDISNEEFQWRDRINLYINECSSLKWNKENLRKYI